MIAVIGDIHGCFYTLEALVKKISSRYPDIEIYCVGDLVDRGKNSFEVISYIMDNGIRFTPGNHDFMFYSYVRQPESLFARAWVYNGNETTLRSYLDHFDSVIKHIEFIKSAPLYFNLEDCFISHAGISERYKKVLPPKLRDNLEELDKLIYREYETETGVLWSRERLLNLGKIQVVGHTKQENVRFDARSNALYIDTGACMGNKLSAAIIHHNELLDKIEEPTNFSDI
ncbi:MAG: diadenosine tetraphosphatase [Ignavibacteria bacterium]|jgi:serine/threonine protein phosphatase 1|nr:diadenosine tetraphosphatase [Ignavibacteria bacterium]MCU7503135.1 diadenosine tetraphosphatase [Ignavibacteria bacterium]MCU7518237.1 diadenosine tetraphosphatase [Ignavibacteria bacterium]